MKELRSKIWEALISTLPIIVIVYIMALLPWFHISGGELIDFSISTVLLLGVFSKNELQYAYSAGHHGFFGIVLGLCIGVGAAIGLSMVRKRKFS